MKTPVNSTEDYRRTPIRAFHKFCTLASLRTKKAFSPQARPSGGSNPFSYNLSTVSYRVHNFLMLTSRRGIKGGKFFPGELISSIKDIILKTFKERIDKSKLKIDGCNFGNELVLGVELEKNEGEKISIELSIDCKQDEPLETRIHLLLDAMGHFLDQALKGRGISVGNKWEEVKIAESILFVRRIS